jgi:hypothetical protein
MDVNTFLNISIFYLSFYFLVETYLVELHYVRLLGVIQYDYSMYCTSTPCMSHIGMIEFVINGLYYESTRHTMFVHLFQEG